jgi:sortase (surface protein transpeptidase)
VEGAPDKRRCVISRWSSGAGCAAGLVISIALLAACASTGGPGGSAQEYVGARDDSSSTRSSVPTLKRFRSTRHYEAIAPPVRIRIPTIEVSSRLQRLGRNSDGTIEIPTEWDVAGWFAGGPRPGQRGPAVILGHVDSEAGPAVFYRVRELRSGDKILVDQRNGRTVKFVVKRIERHDKDAFPTDEVYFPTLKPMLSLITCGGTFDESVGHYRDNVIVFAARVS